MMSPAEISRTFGSTLTSRATFYTEDPSTATGGGRFTVVAASDVPCRIWQASRGQQEPVRDPSLPWRNLNWDATVAPPTAPFQVEIDGGRWQPVVGIIRPRQGIAGETLLWSCELIGVRN